MANSTSHTRQDNSQGGNRRRILLALGYYRHRLHLGVARYAREAGWILHSGMSHDGRPPRNWQGDGIITLNSWRRDILNLVTARKVPTIELGLNPKLPLPRVIQDNRVIGEMVANHFISRGFERIAYLKIGNNWITRELMEYFKLTVEKAGRTFICFNWFAIDSSEKNDLEIEQWLGTQLLATQKPIAIMTQTDERAISVLHACEDFNIRVPEEVAVVGVDNNDLQCDLARVPLSSVDCDEEQQGYQAAALLDRILNCHQPPSEPVLVAPKGIVIRKSSDIMAIKHVEAAAALAYIWENFRKPITVHDVSQNTSMSRRRLHDAFLKYVGRTMREEILRLRLDDAKKMLVESDMKAHEIARACGFSSGDNMGRIFTRELKCSPREYRRNFENTTV